MVTVHLTPHLTAFFPVLGSAPLQIAAATAAEVVQALDALAPGIAGYICDELGRLRPHVNLFVDGQLVRDRRRLTDAVTDGGRVHILQALSGG